MLDKRKKYYVVLDTETTSDKTPEENKKQKIMTKFVYDLGYVRAMYRYEYADILWVNYSVPTAFAASSGKTSPPIWLSA